MGIDLQSLGLEIRTSREPEKDKPIDEIRAYSTYPANNETYLNGQESQRLIRDLQKRNGLAPQNSPNLYEELEQLGSLEDACEYNKTGVKIAGRGLVCSCYNGKHLNATVRTSSGRYGDGTSSVFNPDYRNAYKSLTELDEKTCPFVPKQEKRTEKRRFYFPFTELVDTICSYVFGNAGVENACNPEPGLIIIAGGTGSGKSSIVRGIIYKCLVSILASRFSRVERQQEQEPGKIPQPEKLPHFLTIENPIERYLFVDSDNNCIEPTVVQNKYCIDYTPRQMPKDTPSLEQALMKDALRQTPELVYVGEMREPHEFRTVLDFAGTGHSVVSTMHASSVQEAMQRILAAYEADTPAKRGQIAQRITAVIHLEPFPDDCTVENMKISVPCLWLKKNSGAENLVANGVSSIVMSGASKKDAYCVGRAQFIRKLDATPSKLALQWCIKSDMGLL